MTQILADTPAELSVSFYDGETVVDPGTVTVTITRADGTVLVTDAATDGSGANPRTYDLAAQSDLDLLTAVWSGDDGRKRTTFVEIVGAFIVELADIRAGLNLTDQGKYPTYMLENAREWFTDLVTDFCGFSPVPRLAHAVIDGTGTTRARLTRSHTYVRRLRYATIDGVAVDADTLAAWELSEGFLDTGFIGSLLTSGRGTVALGYEHGLDAAPADMQRAALTATRWRILTDKNQGIPDRVVSMTNDVGGTVQYARANKRYPTGIDDVDATLVRYRMVSVA